MPNFALCLSFVSGTVSEIERSRNSEYHFFFIRTISSYIARWKVSYLGRKLVKWEPNKRGSSWCDAFRLFFALLVPSGWICLPLVLFGLFIYTYIYICCLSKSFVFFVLFFCWVQWFYMSGQHHSEFCISKTVL